MMKQIFVGAIALILVSCSAPPKTSVVPATSPSPSSPELKNLMEKSDQQIARVERLKREGERYEQMSGRCLDQNQKPIDSVSGDCLTWLRDRANGGYYEVSHRICIESPPKTETAARCQDWLVSTKAGGYKDSGN